MLTPRHVTLLNSKAMADRWSKLNARNRRELGSYLCQRFEAAARSYNELTSDLHPAERPQPHTLLDKLAAQLHKLCSRPIERCRSALQANHNDIDKDILCRSHPENLRFSSNDTGLPSILGVLIPPNTGGVNSTGVTILQTDLEISPPEPASTPVC